MGKYAMHEAVSFNHLAQRSSLAQGQALCDSVVRF